MALTPTLINSDFKNWLKGGLALLYTKEGLADFVLSETNEFQNDILQDVYIQNRIPPGTTCRSCTTANVLQCQTKSFCSAGKKCKEHDPNVSSMKPNQPCPNGLCIALKDAIRKHHRYNTPSWKNTDARGWCFDPFEVSKCFMPPDGYSGKTSITDIDFNGLLAVIINNNRFQMKITSDLSKEPNVCTEARVVGRQIRHTANNLLSDQDLMKYIDDLINMLSDPAYLANDAKAKEAVNTLIQLKNNTLTIHADDITDVLNDTMETAISDHLAKLSNEQMEIIRALQKHFEDNKSDSVAAIGKIVNQKIQELEALKLKSLNELKSEADIAKEKVLAVRKQALEDLDESIVLYSRRVDVLKGQGVDELNAHIVKGKQLLDFHGKHVLEDFKRSAQLITSDKIQELQHYLIQFYRENYCKTDISPLIPEEDVDVDDVYVPVKLEGTYKGCNRKVPIETVEQLLCLSKETHESFKNIFISAGVGSGKTTFCKRLVSLWCHAHTESNADLSDLRLAAKAKFYHHREDGMYDDDRRREFLSSDIRTMKKIHFVFVVSLRKAPNDICIEEMIEKQAHLNKSQACVLNDVISGGHSKCLVIVDGLDEWHIISNNQTSSNFVQGLPKRETLRYTVLYTTRPWKIAESKIKTSEISLNVYLSGTEFEDRIGIISKLELKNENRKNVHFADDFSEALSNQHQFMTTPLLIKMLYALWKRQGGLPNSQCRLYSEITDLLLQYTSERNETDSKLLNDLENLKDKSNDVRAPNCFENLRHISEHVYLINAISAVAFKLYFKTQNIQKTRSDILNCGLTGEEFQICLKIGLLTQERAPSTPTSRESVVSFTHIWFQEFLVALYIALYPTTDVINTLELVIIDSNALLESSNILRLVYGMYSQDLKPFNNLLEKVVRKSFSKIKKYYRRSSSRKYIVELSLLFCECAHENKFSGIHCDLPFQHLYLSPETYHAVEKSKSYIKPIHLYCEDYHLWHKPSVKISAMLLYILANNSDHIKTLCLGYIDIGDWGRLCLLSSLSSLTLYNVKLRSAQMNILLSAPNVREVFMNNVDISVPEISPPPGISSKCHEPPKTVLSSRCNSLKKMQISRSQLEYLDLTSNHNFTSLCLLKLTNVSVTTSQVRNMLKSLRLETLLMQNVTCSKYAPSNLRGKSLTVMPRKEPPTQNALKSLIVKNTDINRFDEIFTNHLSNLENLELQRVNINISEANRVLTSPKLQTLHLNKVELLQCHEPGEDIRLFLDDNSTYKNLKSLTIIDTDISSISVFSSNDVSCLEQVTLLNMDLNHAQATNLLSSPRLHNVIVYRATCKENSSFPCKHVNCKMADTLFAHVDSFPLVQKLVAFSDERLSISSILTKCINLKSVTLKGIDLTNIDFNGFPLNHLRRVRLIDVKISQTSLDDLLQNLPSGKILVSLKDIRLTMGSVDLFHRNLLTSRKFRVKKFTDKQRPNQLSYSRLFNMEIATD